MMPDEIVSFFMSFLSKNESMLTGTNSFISGTLLFSILIICIFGVFLCQFNEFLSSFLVKSNIKSTDDYYMKKFVLLFSLFLSIISGISFAADKSLENLFVFKDDIVVEERDSDWQTNGVDLYIRKKDGMESVMLVETAKDPEGKEIFQRLISSKRNATYYR